MKAGLGYAGANRPCSVTHQRTLPCVLAATPRSKKCGCGTIDSTIAAASDLMNRAESQTASRQMTVKVVDTKRQFRPGMIPFALQATNSLLKGFDNGSAGRQNRKRMARQLELVVCAFCPVLFDNSSSDEPTVDPAKYCSGEAGEKIAGAEKDPQ